MSHSISRSAMMIVMMVSIAAAQSGVLNERSFRLQRSESSSPLPAGNSVTDIVVHNDTLWFGSGKGLSRSTDGGRSWTNYYNTAAFGTEDIAAIAVRGKEVWVSTAHSVSINGSDLPEGSGLRYSSDAGETWKSIPQPIDTKNIDTLYWNDKSTIRALGITTAVNNITYDIAIAGNAVYIASFAGMLRVSSDTGKTWQRVILPPDNLTSIGPNDSLVFDLSPSGGALNLQNNLNHRLFSVFAENDFTIWVGTAGGINKTTNRGASWVRYSASAAAGSISGNFVVAIAKQSYGTKNIIWASASATNESEKRSVCYSEDNGVTWKQTLPLEFAHNFGFKENIIYVPTDNGVFRSTDLGQSWVQTGSIHDKASNQTYTQRKFYAAATTGDTVWLGGADGAVSTVDNVSNPFGSTWTMLHARQSLSSVTEVYAYPNPFAPDDEALRIHYSTGVSAAAPVTIRIFDFGMHLVRTVIQNAVRQPGREHDEIWDGKDDNGRQVSNGVYFFHVTVNSGTPRWGKIIAIQ